MAFVVGDRQLLTAAHVINTALGRPRRTADRPTGVVHVLLDFPFGGEGDEAPVGRAAVAAWGPDDGEFLTHDVAGLVAGQPLPTGVPALTLAHGDRCSGAAVQMWGPSPNRRNPGHVSGELMGDIDKGRTQIDQVVRGAFAVGGGFSGGPVWLTGSDRVAGILHAAGEDGTDVYVIHSGVAVDMWPTQLYQPPPSPYPGLRSFTVDDAQRFHGRDGFVDELLADVERRPVLTVMGASGSGKSSVLAAGLVARLRSTASQIELFVRPGDRVVTAIAAAMSRAADHPDLERWQTRLSTWGLAGALGELATITGHDRAVLVLDQLEQALSHRHDADELDRLVGLLADLIEQGRHPSAVVALGVRDDYYGRFVTLDRRVGDYMQRHARPLRHMDESDLRSAIAEPARAADTDRPIRLDERLVAQIVEDFAGQAGDLPLVQFTLHQLWAGQRDRRLTLDSYRDMGGLRRGLILHADECYDRLSEDEQRRARYVFCRFTRTDLQGVGRPVLRTELPAADWAVAGKLADPPRRLVTLARDSATGVETAEIAHEILLRDWPRLQAWRDDDADFLSRLDRTEVARREWSEHGDDSVLRGAVLARAVAIVADRPSETEHVAPFVAHCAAVAERLALARDASARRKARVRRGVVASLATLLVLAAGTAAVAVRESGQASRQQRVAIARRLASEAAAVRESAPDIALRLGIAAHGIAPAPDTRGSLQETVLNNRFAATLADDATTVTAVTFVPGRPVALVCDETGGVTVWDLHDPHRPQVVSRFETGSMVSSAAISADGRRLLIATDQGAELWQLDDRFRAREIGAVPGTDAAEMDAGARAGMLLGNADAAIRLWDFTDPAKPRQAARLPRPGTAVPNYNMSGDGKIAVITADDSLSVWDIRDVHRPRRLGRLRAPSMGQQTIALARDGRLAVTSEGAVYDLSDPRRPRRSGTLKASADDPDAGGGSVALTPDGRTAVVAVPGRPFALWDLRDPGQPSRTGVFGRFDEVRAVAVSSDGRLALTATGSLQVWALRPMSSVPRVGQIKAAVDSGREWAAPIGRDGEVVAIGSRDIGSAELWDLTQPSAPRMVARLPDGNVGITELATAPDRHIALVSGPAGTTVWNVADPARPRRLSSLAVGFDGVGRLGLDRSAHIAVVPALATRGDDNHLSGRATVWDVSRPQEPRRMSELPVPGAVVVGAAVSPDGRLAATEIYHNEDDPPTVALWDLADPARPRRVADALRGASSPVAFNATGRMLVSGSATSSAYLWDVTDVGDVRRLSTVPGLYGAIETASFGTAGETLLLGGEDQTVTVWDVHYPEIPKRLAALTGHTNTVYSAVFGPGEQSVVSGSPSGPALIWDVADVMRVAADPGRVACETVGRGLSPSEWSEYVPDLPYRETC
ncbi:WD40 repeat domain-containing protein [Actinoplanes sp. NPDC049596]|uniref:WD40 repeat domain-containing protein n=1 Tax=unclassified Actinoplanes TaxID=2626549 RepID=UPI00343171DD